MKYSERVIAQCAEHPTRFAIDLGDGSGESFTINELSAARFNSVEECQKWCDNQVTQWQPTEIILKFPTLYS